MTDTTDRPDIAAQLDDPRIEAVGMLLETHNEVTAELERRLAASHDLPVTWLGVLIALARSPEQRLRMSRLAADMTMSTSGLTRLIDRIEAAGYVRREACPSDRRGFWAVLTDEGRRRLGQIAPDHLRDVDEVVAAALDDHELQQLTDLLRRVRDHIRGPEPDPSR